MKQKSLKRTGVKHSIKVKILCLFCCSINTSFEIIVPECYVIKSSASIRISARLLWKDPELWGYKNLIQVACGLVVLNKPDLCRPHNLLHLPASLGL